MPQAAITGTATTYNNLQYRGALQRVGAMETPFTSAIGGLNPNGEDTYASPVFEWKFTDLRDASQPNHLEGQDAPAAQARPEFANNNVFQIFHETVAMSYTRMASTGLFAGVNNDQVGGSRSPFDDQMYNALLTVKRDVEFSAIQGVKANPGTNATARKMGGILEAATAVGHSRDYGATTNLPTVTVTAADDKVASVAHGLNNGDCIEFTALTGGTPLLVRTPYWVINKTADNFELSDEYNGPKIDITANTTAATARKLTPLTRGTVNNVVKRIWNAGGLRNVNQAVLMCGMNAKMALTAAYSGQFSDTSRNVGGVSVDTVLTEAGYLGVMLNPFMPESTIAIVSLDQCRMTYLPTPGKGTFFAEPLAKTGASEKAQLYGEISIKWGNPYAHGVIRGICYAGDAVATLAR